MATVRMSFDIFLVISAILRSLWMVVL